MKKLHTSTANPVAWWSLALAGHALLIVGLWVWIGLGLGLVLVLPLLAALPGLLRRRRYTGGWLTLLLTLYCAALLAEGFSQPGRKPLALALAAVAAVEFVSLLLFVRLAARSLPTAAAAAPAARTEPSADA